MKTNATSCGWLVLVLALAPAGARLDGAEAAAGQGPAPKEPAPKTSVVLPLTPRFNQTRARIDALFAHRNEPPPPPHPRTNPFRPAGPVSAAVAGVRPERPAAGAEGKGPIVEEAAPAASLLQLSAATLKVSGTFEIAGKTHLVINARPYKEGDVVATFVNGEAVYLRVKTISARSVTLALDGVEATVPF